MMFSTFLFLVIQPLVFNRLSDASAIFGRRGYAENGDDPWLSNSLTPERPFRYLADDKTYVPNSLFRSDIQLSNNLRDPMPSGSSMFEPDLLIKLFQVQEEMRKADKQMVPRRIIPELALF